MNTLLAVITAFTLTETSTREYLAEITTDAPFVALSATDGTFTQSGVTSTGRYRFVGLELKRVSVGTGATRDAAKAAIGEAELKIDQDGKTWVTGITAPKSQETKPKFTSVAGTAEEPVLSLVVNPVAGSELVIEGKENLDDASWSPARKGHRFFRAVQKK